MVKNSFLNMLFRISKSCGKRLLKLQLATADFSDLGQGYRSPLPPRARFTLEDICLQPITEHDLLIKRCLASNRTIH